MKLFIVLGLIAFIAVVQGQEEFKCVEGQHYQENKCNDCRCNSDGTLACTTMTCDSHQNQTLVNCEVGKVWKEDCNTCYCVKGIGTVCEIKVC